MVKSAVRAMDAVQAFLKSDEGGAIDIQKFVVAGGSKRGWTTWMTAAVDPRVTAIVPIVIDVLNVKPSMDHHYGAYGFWAPAVGDYVEHKIVDWADTPQYDALLRIEDPYAYRHRFTMPKFIVNAAGDQFFLPDSSQFYFDDLPGEKYLRYVPNTDHSLKDSDAVQSIQAFYYSVLTGQSRPTFSWDFPNPESIRVESSTQPQAVRLWKATNPAARDFRLETLGPAYTSIELETRGEGNFQATVNAPEQGWTAFFIELTFPSGGPFPFKFTTPVRIVPDTLPYTRPPGPGPKSPIP
jgi:PhoPQ-activated pathogenicity-related protein